MTNKNTKYIIVLMLIFLLSFNLFSQSDKLLYNNSQLLVFNKNYLKSDLLLKDDISVIRKNLFYFDIDFFDLGISYGKNIKSSKWFLGGGGKFSVNLYYYLFSSLNIGNGYLFRNSDKYAVFVHEVLYIETIGWYMISKKFLLKTGIKISYIHFWEPNDEGWDEEACLQNFSADIVSGLHFSLLAGSKYVKFGPKISITPSLFGENLFIYYFPLNVSIIIN